MNRRRLAAIALPAIAIAISAALAGPLNPPAGPVAPSYKTLSDVEPRIAISAANTPGNSLGVYVISQPGSYYLTGNISAPSGKSGILVAADPVTIDLNGFSILGSSGATNGVTTGSVYYYNTTVKNGSVAGFSGAGVDLSTVWGGHVQNVTTNGNGTGVKILDGVVESCTAVYGATGFAATGHGSFVRCTSTNNTGTGFTSSGHSVFDGCTSSANGGRGFDVGSYSTVRACVAEGNTSQGIVCVDVGIVQNNVILNNGGANSAGLWVQGDYGTYDANEIVNNGYGVYVGGTGNLIIRNRVGSSTQSNFYIVAGNRVGTIATAGNNAALINGSSGGGLGTTDPYANIVR